MNDNTLRLLHLLIRDNISDIERSELRERVLSLPSWDELIRQAELYAVAGIVYENLQRHGFEIDFNVELSFKALIMRHRLAADVRHQVLAEILQALSELVIPVVILKGAALAPMLFDQDWQRPMRDMDILVPKAKLDEAATCLRSLGFNMPDEQPSRFMRYSHQLPNATLERDGFTVSVELHHDAFASDVRGSLFYEDVESELQTVQWQELSFQCMGHEHMLHHVSRHLEGVHPGGVLKLANVLDLVLYAEKYLDQIDWLRLSRKYPHVINSLRCAHYIRPLSLELQARIERMPAGPVKGVGEIMLPLSSILSSSNGFKNRLGKLFFPPDWWLHLFYNVHPDKALVWVKCVRHPYTLLKWFATRMLSRLLGG